LCNQIYPFYCHVLTDVHVVELLVKRNTAYRVFAWIRLWGGSVEELSKLFMD
jgi:hypothetical protein